MRAMILAAMLALCGPATAQDQSEDVLTERELREACSFEASGVRECLEQRRAESEATLKTANESILTAVGRWDTDAKFASQTRQKLRESSSAFLKYRDAQCAFATSLGAGAIGNALEMRRLACVAELNLRRAASLRASASELRSRQ